MSRRAKNRNTEKNQNWQYPFTANCIFCQILASRAKCEFTTGRVPCLNQSNDFASLDLSVLFLKILPVNTSASTGPPYCNWSAYCTVVLCNATNPAKNMICNKNTKGPFSLLSSSLFLHGSKALKYKRGHVGNADRLIPYRIFSDIPHR